MKKLILTVLDDNHKLWYENFIPFVLSLKETDYDGDIAVIDYGLSQEKKQRLSEQGIRLYPAAHKYADLIVDRHYSMAEIAKQDEYDYLAIYDADIWFPNAKLTVFDQIKKKTSLYCAYDVWYCTFLGNCVRQYGVDKVHQELQTLVQKNGFVWQAGVIVGHKKAWLEYQKYMETMLSNEDNFAIAYGIDATILNLYSVHTNRIAYLDKKYNCPLAWGIRQSGTGSFSVDGEIVEGIHLTRAHRDNPHFNYIKLKAERYYSEGMKFVEKGQQIYSIRKDSLTEPYKNEFDGSEITLQITEVLTNGKMTVRFDSSKLVFSENALVLDVAGYSKLSFKNINEETVTLIYARTSIVNMEESENVFITLDGNKLFSDRNRSFRIDIRPNQEITFITKDLDINKGMRWLFKNTRLVS